MDIAQFKRKPVMGILRGAHLDSIEPLLEVVIAAGLETIEITMNTPGALVLIRKAAGVSRGRLTLGAGTVLSITDAKAAVEAGATFIVMPTLVREVVAYCVKNRVAAFPGALTPQEIYTAWNEGATMVKVFPAKFFGPEYFKELKGPFNTIELLACAGVTPANVAAYFSHGASAVSFGASVFKKEWLTQGDFTGIGPAIKDFLRNMPSC